MTAQTPAIMAHTTKVSLKASAYATRIALSCAELRNRADDCKVATCSSVTIPGSSRCLVAPRMAVEAAIPMLPPSMRAWATIPWATAGTDIQHGTAHQEKQKIHDNSMQRGKTNRDLESRSRLRRSYWRLIPSDRSHIPQRFGTRRLSLLPLGHLTRWRGSSFR